MTYAASRDKVRVIVVTDAFRIEGDLHVLAGSRLTDALNAKSKDFFAMTDVRVHTVNGTEVMWSPPYLAVNREAISCLFPIDDVQPG
jgi:hypothetical protein